MRLPLNVERAVPPNLIKAAQVWTAQGAEGVLAQPRPKIFLHAFADSAITDDI